MARQRSDLRPVAAAGALTLLALVLRVLAARQSLGGDELFSLEVAARPGLGDVLDGVRGPLEITPPGYFVLGWAFARLGDPTYWLKAPSVLAGTLTVPVAYAIGARTVGRWAGVVGAALLAISPYAIFYGSEARAYALTALAVAVATLLLLVALERRRWPRWAAFAAAVAASMYAHYVAAFPLAALLAWALWYHRDAWRPLLLAYAAAAVAYLPWIPGLLDDRTSPYQHAIGRVWGCWSLWEGSSCGGAAGVPVHRRPPRRPRAPRGGHRPSGPPVPRRPGPRPRAPPHGRRSSSSSWRSRPPGRCWRRCGRCSSRACSCRAPSSLHCRRSRCWSGQVSWRYRGWRRSRRRRASSLGSGWGRRVRSTSSAARRCGRRQTTSTRARGPASRSSRAGSSTPARSRPISIRGARCSASTARTPRPGRARSSPRGCHAARRGLVSPRRGRRAAARVGCGSCPGAAHRPPSAASPA